MAKRKPNNCDNRKSLEQQSFYVDDTAPGEYQVWRAVHDEKSHSNPLSGVEWDAHSKSVVSNVVTYSYYSGGLSGTLLAQATLTYADDTLCDLTSSEWSYFG